MPGTSTRIENLWNRPFLAGIIMLGVSTQLKSLNLRNLSNFKAMDDGRGFLGGGRMMTKMATSRY